MQFQAMVPTGQVDIQAIKQALPCTFVLHDAYGSTFTRDAGEWITVSPFRPDRNPSFRIYGEFLDRWIDFAEGRGGGDVFDLIERVLAAAGVEDADEFPRKLAEAQRLLSLVGEWDGPKEGPPKATFNVEQAKAYLQSLEDQGAEALAVLLERRSDTLHDADPYWLAQQFQIHADEDGLIIPYLDRARELIAVKTRSIVPGSKTMSAAGSTFADILYGEHLDVDPERTVVLCEGETDVWSGTHALRDSDEFVFLGLPTGAGAYPRQAPRLAGRRVVLAFDGDSAGRGALRQWVEALLAVDCTVHVAPVPEGRDLAQVHDVPGLIAAGMRHAVRPPVGTLTHRNGSYWKRVRDDVRSISNFELDISSTLSTPEGETAYEVQANGNGARWTLTQDDLVSTKAFKSWALGHGLAWLGTEADTTELASLLKYDGLFVPGREAVTIAGYHEGHYVWPSGSLGPRDVQYLAPTERAVGKVDIRITPVSQHPGFLVRTLAELHAPEVTNPILAWLAVAPVRALLDRFPILNVTGASGSGKTTLLTRMVQVFSGSHMMSTLTGTTRFAVLAQLQSTNAFPVWFDEYRPGARSTTLQELNQLLRDAYSGQASLKGGAGETWNEVTEFRTTAPIIVSGEDNFHETSHLERMILVHLPREGKRPDVLASLPEEGTTSFVAHSYLSWLLLQLDRWGVPEVTPAGPEDWNERQRYNLGVLNLGWSLLNGWLHDGGYDHLGDPDWTIVIAESQQAQDSDPLLEAIEWALGEPLLSQDVWAEAGGICIRVETLVRETRRLTDIVLPGSAQAISRLLISKYHGQSLKRDLGQTGVRKRVIRIPTPHQLL